MNGFRKSKELIHCVSYVLLENSACVFYSLSLNEKFFPNVGKCKPCHQVSLLSKNSFKLFLVLLGIFTELNLPNVYNKKIKILSYGFKILTKRLCCCLQGCVEVFKDHSKLVRQLWIRGFGDGANFTTATKPTFLLSFDIYEIKKLKSFLEDLLHSLGFGSYTLTDYFSANFTEDSSNHCPNNLVNCLTNRGDKCRCNCNEGTNTRC